LQNSTLIVNITIFYMIVPTQSPILIKYVSVRSERERIREKERESTRNECLSRNKSSCCCYYVFASAQNVKTPGKQPEWPKGPLGNRSRGSICYRFICFSRGQGRVARIRSILPTAAALQPPLPPLFLL